MATVQSGPLTSTVPGPALHTFEIIQIDRFNAENKVVFIRINDKAISDRPIYLGLDVDKGEVHDIYDRPPNYLDEPVLN
jgi:hypothetical protein